MKFIVAISLIIFVIAVLSADSPGSKGAAGERRVTHTLHEKLNPEEYKVYNDLTLPTPSGGTTQVDHVVVSRFGVFVIETKNMIGWVFGSADQRHWTITYRRSKKRTRMLNPLHQNYGHVKAVQELTGLHKSVVHNIVVFVGSASPKTALPSQVTFNIGQLLDEIRSHRQIVLSEEDVKRVADALSADKVQTTKEVREDHVRHVTAQKERRTTGCPRCGSDMLKRTNRRTGSLFLGCSKYPRCLGTRDA